MVSASASLSRVLLRTSAIVVLAFSGRGRLWGMSFSELAAPGAHRESPRRALFGTAAWTSVAVLASTDTTVAEEFPMIRTASGLQYSDVREGVGDCPKPGTRVTLDYVMMTTGARYGAKIDSTKDREEPYSFVLGDPSVIAGLQEAVRTMRSGGIRRIIIPASLGYTDETKQPVPPGLGEFQRFKNIYLNSNRVYQPDLVLDVKLFRFENP